MFLVSLDAFIIFCFLMFGFMKFDYDLFLYTSCFLWLGFIKIFGSVCLQILSKFEYFWPLSLEAFLFSLFCFSKTQMTCVLSYSTLAHSSLMSLMYFLCFILNSFCHNFVSLGVIFSSLKDSCFFLGGGRY